MLWKGHLVKASRPAVLALIGVATAGVLTLGVAAPANAVDVAPLSSYMLTVPPSVYSASAGYSTTEQVAWREIARVGTDPKPPTVPVSPSTGWGITAGIQALWLGGMAVVQNAGTLGTVFTVNPDQLSDRYAEQGLTAEEGLQCESLEGDWLGDFFTGVNDWFQSLFGVDCAAMRDGELEKNPAWDPLHVDDPALSSYPLTATRSTGSMTLLQPIWSDTTYVVNAVTRKEGWIQPINFTGTGNFYVHGRLANASGAITNSDGWNLFSSTTTFNANQYASAPCGATRCLRLDQWFSTTTGVAGGTTGVPSSPNWALTGNYVASIKYIDNSAGTNFGNLPTLPYVNTLTGSYNPASEEVVFLTTVETGDGNIYQCRTAPFLETDADVPTPCDPVIPFGQWEVSRTVEMIPASTGNADWIVGSDPRRVMTDQQTPAEYQDWREAFPECSGKVCRMDLVKVGLGSCFLLGETCDGWLSDPNRATNYTCTYDGQTIALSECEAGYPNVFSQTARDLGQAYPQPNDPATGQPSTGGQTSTTAGPTIMPGSLPLPPNQPRNCFPTGWNAFNPYEWVYQPVRCSLEWAFVPRQEALTLTTMGITTAFNGSSMGQLSGALAAVVAVLPGDGGCGGIPFSYDMRGVHIQENLLYSCSGPLAPAAGVTKTILTGSVIVAALLACTRYVATVFGFVGYGNAQQERAAAADARKAGRS